MREQENVGIKKRGERLLSRRGSSLSCSNLSSLKTVRRENSINMVGIPVFGRQ
jgi:hypothetical protein